MAETGFKTIADEFKSCVAATYPEGTTPEQFHQLRAMFYAGVMVTIELNKAIGDPSVSEDEGVSVMQSWDAEIGEFWKEYRRHHGI